MNETDAATIVEVVLDMIDAGPVGLYELVDQQRTPRTTRSLDAMIVEARTALELLCQRGARLVWQVWADARFLEDANSVEPRPEDWQTPGDAPYLAVAWPA